MKTGFVRLLAILFGCLVLAGTGVRGGEFRAAVAKVDFTPEDRPDLIGYAPRTSVGVNDRLYHRIVALDDGTTQVFLVSSEVGAVSPALHDKVAATLAREHGIAPEALWWTVTHTHSAPQVGPPGLVAAFLGERFQKPFDEAYAAFVERRLIEGVLEARARLAPARLGVAWGSSSANINRRARLPDGRTTLGMNPDGPVDRRIGLLRLEKADGTLLALVANYPIHGTVMGSQNLLVSGDVTGIVSAYVERKTGVPMLFINGAAGDLAPIYSGYADPREGQLAQFEVLLGDRILAANETASATTGEVKLKLGGITVETPLKDGLAWPAELSAYARPGTGGGQFVKIPVRFLRINADVAIWSAPLELFCEVSNAIRERSPFPYTFYFGYANGWLGYLPTAEEFARGGYEPLVSPFTPAAAGQLTEAVAAGLQNAVAR
jgi:hypothetical protein